MIIEEDTDVGGEQLLGEQTLDESTACASIGSLSEETVVDVRVAILGSVAESDGDAYVHTPFQR